MANDIHARLDRYKAAQDQKAANDAAQKEKELRDLVARAQAPDMQQQLSEFIEVANHAMRVGIGLKHFVADGCRHNVGLIERRGTVVAVGIRNGGACGPIDLHVDGERCTGISTTDVIVCGERRTGQPVPPRAHDIKRFLADWPKLRDDVYAHLDKLCPAD